jgi:hypothetical protein
VTSNKNVVDYPSRKVSSHTAHSSNENSKYHKGSVKDVYNKSRDSYKPPMKIPPTTPNPKGLAKGIAQKGAKDNILAAKMKSEMLYAHGRVKPRLNREQTT